MDGDSPKTSNLAVDARGRERQLLDRCVFVARHADAVAANGEEADLFRLAGSVLRSRLPDESRRLKQASADWFAHHRRQPLEAAEMVRSGMVVSLPRLRDMLSRRLRWNSDG